MLVAYKMLWLFVTGMHNDLIEFSSDEQLMEAVKNVSTDGILRVFIHEKPPAVSSVPQPLHAGVTSDTREFHLNFHTLYGYNQSINQIYLLKYITHQHR